MISGRCSGRGTHPSFCWGLQGEVDRFQEFFVVQTDGEAVSFGRESGTNDPCRLALADNHLGSRQIVDYRVETPVFHVDECRPDIVETDHLDTGDLTRTTLT